MRYHEIISGLRLPVSAEEQGILDKVGPDGIGENDFTDERDAEVARTMMMRGLLNKSVDRKGKKVYRKNSAGDIPIDRY